MTTTASTLTTDTQLARKVTRQPLTKWQRYEFVKRHIARTAASPTEYQRRIRKIAQQLGV